MSKVVPELPPFRTEGEEFEEPTERDLRLALLHGNFAEGARCLGLMREETVFAAGLGYATTHALLAVRTALLDNEDTVDCMLLWAVCRVRVMQQFASEWDDSEGTQGLRAHAAATEFRDAVIGEAERLPSIAPEPVDGVWTIPVNEDGETEPMRELQGHLLRIGSLIQRVRDVRSFAIIELVQLSLGKREAISSELGAAIEAVRKLDEAPRRAVVQSILNAASEWESSGANVARNRATCDGEVIGLCESLGRTDSAEWSELFYLAARARANTPKFGSWYVATLTLMEALGLEQTGASKDPARRRRLENDMSEWKTTGQLAMTRRAG